MKLRNISLIIIILAFFSSCEKEVKDLGLPQFVQKLVITSFLSPDDTISLISVTSNSPVYGELKQYYDPGILSGTITDGNSTINLTPCQEGLYFRDEEMKVEEGRTYTIRIQSSRDMKAEASCTVPVRKDLELETDTTISYIDRGEYYQGYVVTSKIYLRDPSGEDNYFRFFCKAMIYDHGYYYYPEQFRLIGSEDEIFSDDKRDGSRILVNTTMLDFYPRCDSAFLVFYVLNTDKSYYLYHKSLGDYTGGSDDPFTEMSPVYSNISGGLGIFAAYSADSLVLKLK